MKFRYKKLGPGVIRPIIPIKVSFGGTSVSYEVLIDSGADLCLFDREIGELIGIDFSQGEIHKVAISVGGWDFNIKAGFGPMPAMGHGIVGQKGFFDLFVVKFDFSKEIIELKDKKRV